MKICKVPAVLKLFLFLSLLVSSQLSAQNLISNGGFEDDFDDWTNLTGTNGAMAIYSLEPEVIKEGAQAFRIAVKELGANAWDNQVIHKGYYPKENEEYTLTFYAKSAGAGTGIKAVVQNTTYLGKDFTLSTDWQKYEWVFTAKESYLQLKFHFTHIGTVYLDEISITGKNLKPVVVRPTDTTTIDISKKHQKIEGFGASLAFYENWITEHPYKTELYQLAFEDLGLDWLRVRNDYKYQQGFGVYTKEFVQKAKELRGDKIRVLMCGWTPPATLKNNNNANNGTLKRENGQFIYNQYADYWKDALKAYAEIGVKPDWVSIQNEPDWLTEKWETCKFTDKESEQYPGYDKAFAAVVEKIKDLPEAPKLLGSEAMGIGNNQFEIYNRHIKDNPGLFAYAYHLYNGGDPDYPDSYNGALRNIKKDFGNRPNVMTEYEHRDAAWFKTAWLMSNVLTEANATAYFYWDLIWPKGGLINIGNPWDRSEWTNPKGYERTKHFYAFKHFSKFIDAGYVRIENLSSNEFVKSSAYVNETGNSITVVLVNSSKKPITTTLNTGNLKAVKSQVIQSKDGAFFSELGQLPKNNQLLLPEESVTTIILTL